MSASILREPARTEDLPKISKEELIVRATDETGEYLYMFDGCMGTDWTPHSNPRHLQTAEVFRHRWHITCPLWASMAFWALDNPKWRLIEAIDKHTLEPKMSVVPGTPIVLLMLARYELTKKFWNRPMPGECARTTERKVSVAERLQTFFKMWWPRYFSIKEHGGL